MSQIEVPEKITVMSEFGQKYELDAANALWPEALRQHVAEVDPIVFPLARLSGALEWGWWSCFKSQEEWLAGCGVPVPDHDVLGVAARGTTADLADKLQEFAGYVAWLEAQLGVMEGRRGALAEGYKAAVLVASADAEGKGTEKSKEAQALARSETLRQTKRLLIEQETVLATAKGLLDSYQAAYDATSRILTARQIEAETTTRRHA